MTRTRRNAIIVAVFVLALGAVFVAAVIGDGAPTHGSLLGKPAPAFDVKTLGDGTPLSTAKLTGRTIVVNFWNSWCIPCRQEHEALQTFYDAHRDEGDFTMIGIVRDDTEGAVRDYVKAERVTWPVAMDPNGAAAVAYGTTGQPETYVIGPDGVVHGELWGPATFADLELMLRRAQGRG